MKDGAMNKTIVSSIKPAQPEHVQGTSPECASRWVIHCICCEVPVEPWQTIGYQTGYCAECYGTLMAPDDDG